MGSFDWFMISGFIFIYLLGVFSGSCFVDIGIVKKYKTKEENNIKNDIEHNLNYDLLNFNNNEKELNMKRSSFPEGWEKYKSKEGLYEAQKPKRTKMYEV